MVWGISRYVEMPNGPNEHVLSYYSCVTSVHDAGTLCFDTCFVPPYGDLVFGDNDGGSIYPEVGWTNGGKCWPILNYCDCIPGDANGDGQVNVGDAVYLIAYIFKQGPPPVLYATCSGDANCDCTCNVGDAVYIISYVFKGGPPPCSCVEWLSICGCPIYK
jgi:hypothetical protein